MAMEDAVCLSECLSRTTSHAQIPQLTHLYEQFRMERCYTILDGARNNGAIWHLADGPQQRARDERMKNGSKPRKPSDAGADTGAENPNKWSDPKFQPWMFGFDATEDVIPASPVRR
jgi:salicylate hydroxylase